MTKLITALASAHRELLSTIAAGGDENHDRVEDILRGWVVKHSESKQFDDQTKAKVQLLLANNFAKAQRYDLARNEYTTVKNRYPKTPQAIEAEFGIFDRLECVPNVFFCHRHIFSYPAVELECRCGDNGSEAECLANKLRASGFLSRRSISRKSFKAEPEQPGRSEDYQREHQPTERGRCEANAHDWRSEVILE